MALKSVLIDVGNTLLRERQDRAAIYAAAAAAHGLELSGERMAELMRRAHAELPERVGGAWRYSDRWFEAFLERIFGRELGLSEAQQTAVRSELFERFSDPATFRLYPGALELLEGARALGLRVGIVSNWSERLPRLLEAVGIAPRVDFVLCSALEGVEKPDPRLFELALERARCAPEEALHAGDHPELDVAAARAVGIEPVLVDHHGNSPPVEALRVGSLLELLEHLRGRTR